VWVIIDKKDIRISPLLAQLEEHQTVMVT
jgi:hypothetical protein